MSHPLAEMANSALNADVDARSRELLSGGSLPCYLIGRNSDAQNLVYALKVQGLVDDGAPSNTRWNDLPVIRSVDLPADAILINASTSIRPVDVIRRFALGSGIRLIGLHDVIAASQGALAWPDFVVDQRSDWAEHFEEWCNLFDRLADDESRRTLGDVLRFRLSANPAWMMDYDVRIDVQYFEPFLNLENETFVDAGGFDGDTTEMFCSVDPGYRAVHIFEPSALNMGKARKRLSGYRDISFHQVGLSDVSGRLAFDPHAGSASAVTGEGSETIEVVALDQAVSDPVTFIKMDLEGWETYALKGARHHILATRPKLAIAAYHKASDFRDITRFAMKAHQDYRIYLRHYTQGWSETVLFFV